MTKKSERGREELQRMLLQLAQAGSHLPYGTFAGVPHELYLQDANIGLLDFGINDAELTWLDRIHSGEKSCARTYERSLDEVVRTILANETTFDLARYEVVPSVTGFRGAFNHVVSRLVASGRPIIAYASPNWFFDDIVAQTPGAIGHSFFAHSPDTFVRGLESLPNKDKTGAIVVVDPSNPLGYRLTRDHVVSLEGIARSHGIIPVFDDVFRGLQAPGQRHSSSEYSTNSIIIETSSKRFGARGLGVTWSLFPTSLQGLEPSSLRPTCAGCASLAALVTDALYITGHDTRVRDMLVKGTNAFMQGLRRGLNSLADPGAFSIGFEGMPLFTYHFPESFIEEKRGDRLLSLHNYLVQVAGVTPGYQWICNLENRQSAGMLSEEEAALGVSYVRICPTKEPPHRLYTAGELIGGAASTFHTDPSSFILHQKLR